MWISKRTSGHFRFTKIQLDSDAYLKHFIQFPLFVSAIGLTAKLYFIISKTVYSLPVALGELAPRFAA